MKQKCFGIGVVVTLTSFIYGFSTNEWETTVKIIAISAVVPLLITGLLTGAFVSGDRNRANNHTEVKEDRELKSKWIKGFLLISAPNAVSMIILMITAMINS
ncbi:DUF5316 domain-containing protein [Halobacillus litoralis]|uniref:DUF5316 domain-containing protein n=1 Tax=Halobacillus litoralis TaxID=45668 RepID=A0A410M9J0_9BACI|nr:DUF5316 domain-containing protein [Halobacillus litoralis]QAS51399.1 hypothetical protein HLI_03785 [Halobacillus litoralis]